MLVGILAPLDFWTSQLTASLLARAGLWCGTCSLGGHVLDQKGPSTPVGEGGEGRGYGGVGHLHLLSISVNKFLI